MNPEYVIPRRLEALGCPVSAFAVIYGRRSQAYLSQAFRGNHRLSGPEVREMFQLLDELEQLARNYDPLPIDFSQGLRIRAVLHYREFATGVAVDGVKA